MPENGRCDAKGCKGKGIVGLGSPPRWLCLDCFNKALSGAKETATKLARLMRASPQEKP